MTRSTASISARLAAGSLRSSGAMLLIADIALPLQALEDLKSGRAGLAIDEDGGLRGGDLGFAFRRLGVGEGHGAFP